MNEAERLNMITDKVIGVALLINFNVEILKNGIQRIVNNFPSPLRTQRSLR